MDVHVATRIVFMLYFSGEIMVVCLLEIECNSSMKRKNRSSSVIDGQLVHGFCECLFGMK